MGVQCVRTCPRNSRNSHSDRMDTLQSQLLRCESSLDFTLTIEHLKLTNMTSKVKQIRFRLSDQFDISYHMQDFTVSEKLIASEKIQRVNFGFPANKLDSQKLLVQLLDHSSQVIETLKIKLLHLCTGPIHHDHLLKELKARIMFDIQIFQNISLKSILNKPTFTLQPDSSFDLSTIFYRFSFTTETSQYNAQSHKQFYGSQNGLENLETCSNIPNNYLKEANFKIQLLTSEIISDFSEEQEESVLYTFFIPYQRLEKCETYTSLNRNGIDYISKKLEVSEKIEENGQEIGRINFILEVESSILYAEQMEGLILSEIGVNAISPTVFESDEGLIKELEQGYKAIKKMKSDNFEDKTELVQQIEGLYKKFQTAEKEGFTSEEELYERQLIFIKLLNELSSLISEGQDILNERIWRIVDIVVHRTELTSRYLTIQQSEQKRTSIFLKFYKFMGSILQKIIRSTEIGITFRQLQYIQKFLAFAYFRFPWVQRVIIRALHRKTDPEISEEKLQEYGASSVNKSPSKSYVYDWEKNIYNSICNKEEFKVLLQSLKETSAQHEDWDSLLFNRGDEDLFYGLYVEIWTEAEYTLKNIRGGVLWEYFPHYGELLSSFLGQMNNSKLSEFSDKFKLCSNKLALNEKLLNTFVNLLFPKTYLYEISCVLKCLDLLESYFESLHNRNKKLPHDFHFNFFYTGIRTIFNQNHSYLIVKTLLIIYKYSSVFTQDFKKILNGYLLSKEVFYRLFLHWCSNVRKMFHSVIYFRIVKVQQNPEENHQMQTSSKTKENEGFQQELSYSRKLNIFLRTIQNASFEFNREKLSESRISHKSYHQQMKATLRSKKERRKKEKELERVSLEMSQKKQPLNEESMLIRKNSEFVTINDLSKFKERKMSVGDAYIENIDEKYIKYSMTSLKQYNEVKKEPNPNKAIQKLSRLFQGDIDS